MCHSCKMKIINNRQEDKVKRSVTRTANNSKMRKSLKRQEIVKNKEFTPRNLSIIGTFIDNDDELNYKFKCNICNYEGTWSERAAHLGMIKGHPFCENCYKQSRSRPEDEIINFIKTFYSGNILKNDRNIIKPKELDIFIPELKIGIEYNGLHWHKGENFGLLEKTQICQNIGVKLIQVFEDEWLFHKEKIEKIIKDIITTGTAQMKDISFIKDNILYIDLRFPFEKQTLKFLGNSKPRKLYFFDKQFTSSIKDENDYVYDCGFACYSLDSQDHEINKFDFNTLKKENKEITIVNRNQVLELEPFQKVKFICPECNKEKHYLAKTMQVKDEFICGNCSQKLHYPRKNLK